MLMNSFYRTFLCFDTVARLSLETKTFSFVCVRAASSVGSVSYTHLTLPTKLEV